MLHLIGFVLFGLIVGAIARFLLPGRQSMGWIMTIVLGMVGSVVGGFLGSLLFQGAGVWQPGGWIASIVGAVLVLVVYGKLSAAKK